MQQSETPQTKRINAILKRPANKFCFECGAKQPRWGSTNLGILFCIRCAGFFRSLGVHICKVKSTNMDLWDDSMIDVIDRIGNENGRALYEARLPAGYTRIDQFTESIVVERAIKMKYGTRNYWDEDYDLKYSSLMERASSPTPGSDISDVGSNTCSSAPGFPVYDKKGITTTVYATGSTLNSGTVNRTVNNNAVILQGTVVSGKKPTTLNATTFFDAPSTNIVATPSLPPVQSTNTNKNVQISKNGNDVFDELFSSEVVSSNHQVREMTKPAATPYIPVAAISPTTHTSHISGNTNGDSYMDDILDSVVSGTSYKIPIGTSYNPTPDSQHAIHPFDSSSPKMSMGNHDVSNDTVSRCTPSIGRTTTTDTTSTSTTTIEAMTAALNGLSGDGSGRTTGAINGNLINTGMYQSTLSGARERAW